MKSKIALTALLFSAGSFFIYSSNLLSQQIPPTEQSNTAALAQQPWTVLVSATSQGGGRPDLVPADVVIKVDGAAATTSEVHPMIGQPMRYALLFDSSHSLLDDFKAQVNEASALLSRVVKGGRDYGYLVAIQENPYLDAQSSDPQQLVTALRHEKPWGGTALYDAIFASSYQLTKNTAGPGMRVMFLFTDGKDTVSKTTAEVAARALLVAGVRVYAIGNGNPSPQDRELLTRIAESSGGRAYFVSGKKEGDRVIEDIDQQLSSLFSVSFMFAGQDADGKIHQLQIGSSRDGILITGPDRYFRRKPLAQPAAAPKQ